MLRYFKVLYFGAYCEAKVMKLKVRYSEEDEKEKRKKKKEKKTEERFADC